MNPKLLFWYEVGTVGKIYTELDRWCSYFGFDPVAVDCIDGFKGEPGQYPIKTTSLCGARELLSDHTWVFLDPDGDVILDELDHPATPVVYAVGSNLTGFGCTCAELPEDALKVRLRRPDVIWDYQAAQMAMYDRQLYLGGRRA